MSNQENLTQEELQTKVGYIFSNSFNHTQHAYIDISGDLVAGTLLSQIMYWFSLDRNKKSKIRIFKDGNYWLAKGREDWFEEIRISPKQYDTAVKKLKEKGLVETKLYKFNAVPTTHIRPIFKEINAKINEWKHKIELEITNGTDIDIPKQENSVLPNGENGIFRSVNIEFDKEGNSLTENTNIDYITDNSFANEKDNSQETWESNNSRIGEYESCISMSLGVKQKAKETPLKDMPTRAKEIADKLVDRTELSDGVYDCIEYFLEKYKAKNRKEHLPLRNDTLQRVVETMLSSITVPHYENLENKFQTIFYPLVCFMTDWEDRKEVIDRYFDTKFNYIDEDENGKEKKIEVDYSLVHFTHADVITHIMQKCHIGADIEWYESEHVN